LRIPNLTLKPYSRGPGGFDGYPDRMGWTSEEVTGHNAFGARSAEQTQSFFQNWLFFGCAIEILSISGIDVCNSDLCDETGQFVSTRRLPGLIRQWRTKVQQLGGKSSGTHIEWAMKTALILKRVSEFVDAYCLPYYGARRTAKLGGASSPVSELTWISIIAMGQTLGEAMISYYDIVRTGNHWGASRLLKQRLLDNGWCPVDVERTMTDIGIDGHYYLSLMERAESHISHKDCNKSQCTAHIATYRQKHVCESCQCGEGIQSNVSATMAIIEEEGHVPVVRWDAQSRRLVNTSSRLIRRGFADPPFVAISHV
ncbi:hypothetical protein CC80DRAFT_401601, partial [Byssothecium circinans]